MPSSQKRKGSSFERDIVNTLNENLTHGSFKRCPSSGSIGTIMSEPLLTGDVNGTIYGFPTAIKAECKVGYSNKTGADAKSLTLAKSWLDKIKVEAINGFRMPMLFGKFDNVRNGVKIFVTLDLDTFLSLANHITKMREELDKAYAKLDNH